jgi:RNA polymerase sigma factor (sigma-70 family)
MAVRRFNEVVENLRRAVLLRGGAELTDGQLLERFLTEREEAALAALVRRHAAMVWGVCHRLLRNHHDAEDAFQVTFLVLVRRAASIVPRDKVANWLFGVARQTALKARATAARRKERERQMVEMPEPAADAREAWTDWQPFLDRELARLPEKYRVPIVLCDLEGRSLKETARQLGWPPGTVAGRLARARRLLAQRLGRRGVMASGGALAAVLSQQAASGAVPSFLVARTIQAVALVAAGATAAGLLSAQVAALAEGVVKAMMLTKLRIVRALVLALAVLGTVLVAGGWLMTTAGVGRQATAAPAQQQTRDEVREAAIKALEQFGKSGASADREAAIKAVNEFGKALKKVEPPRQQMMVLANRFKYRIPFQIGTTRSKNGGRIAIQEVWGTRPKIEVGGQYLVHGRYTLPAQPKGKLYFYMTANNWEGFGPDFDLQSMQVQNGEGEFTLLHAMNGPGFFHLALVGENGDRSETVADTYFGTGDNVWRK